MRKMQLVLAGIFLGGVLLGGIGTGIALVEYSSLSYGGEHRIGEENLVTNNYDFEFDPGEWTVSVDDTYYLDGICVKKIESDTRVPVGVVRYEVTYNENLVTPVLQFDMDEAARTKIEEGPLEESDETPPGYLGRIWLTATYQGSSFGILMENKDRFLEELKNKMISDYKVLYITDIKVKANPETVPYVKLRDDIR